MHILPIKGRTIDTITKEITNPKEAYEKGEEVLFKIKVTNNANLYYTNNKSLVVEDITIIIL